MEQEPHRILRPQLCYGRQIQKVFLHSLVALLAIKTFQYRSNTSAG